MDPEIAAYLIWAVWGLTWLLASVWSGPTARRAHLDVEALYGIVTLAGFYLLFSGFHGRTPYLFGLWDLAAERGVPLRVWTLADEAAWALVGATAAAFLMAWWARMHLGRLWSGTITLKEDHRVVETGPYRTVRHPIYTALIIAAFALAAIKGLTVAFAGAAVIAIGFWIKAGLEERFLSEELGDEAYGAYRKRVPMLIPFAPR